jgi:hypothetical protein
MTANAFSKGIVRRAVPIAQEGEEDEIIYVRGLSPADIAQIMEDDGGHGLSLLYGRLTNDAKSPEDVVEIGMAILTELPDLMAHIIARAGDQPDEWKTVLGFALGDQLELLQAIAELTFRSASVTKKVMEIVSKSAKGKPMAELFQNGSKTGSGV